MEFSHDAIGTYAGAHWQEYFAQCCRSISDNVHVVQVGDQVLGTATFERVPETHDDPRSRGYVLCRFQAAPGARRQELHRTHFFRPKRGSYLSVGTMDGRRVWIWGQWIKKLAPCFGLAEIKREEEPQGPE